MPLTPGQRLGGYEIVAALGAGGMGEVYRARDLRLGRDVALKILPEAVARDTSRLARFEREAQTVARLNHPGIVTLYSVEDADGVRFLTMELVEGEGLDRQVRPGGLPVERVLALGLALTDALEAAHRQGIVHRDLKPQNVMLGRDGQIKILDFGLAKLEDAADFGADQAGEAETRTVLSAPGQVVGTLPYMAPEQVRGESADTRTDLFALGVLLFELATGRRPFQGATAGVLSSAILRDQAPSLSSLRVDLPRELESLIARCLEKDPDARFQSAGELGRALRHLTQSGQPHPPDPQRFRVLPPVPSTPLLGREQQLADAGRCLQEGARLLTITGYGGTGKTRFAIELFHRQAAAYAGGAAFVSLVSVTEAAEVLPTVSIALDIAEAHGRTALEALSTVIGEQRVLLVLDNLEQVLEAAGGLADLVSLCPGLQVVSTSRAPLKVGAELEYPLPPLALPEAGEESLEALQACPSVTLFVQRASRVKPDFQLSGSNADAVSSICRRLDGLPLALELAAARVRILEPAKLLQRLDHALDLLTSGDRDLPLRQRTLRATISWSYSLLEANEQQLLRRCSVFHEGWTFEALEQVCYDEADRVRALDELESLVEKGLVRVTAEGGRYALLETIRAFAAEQLHAGGEVERMRDAHADFFVQFTAGMAAAFRDERQVPATLTVRQDNANELAAIHWLTTQAQEGGGEALEKALLLCGQLDWFWHVSGLHNTARKLVDELLELAAEAAPSRGRGLGYLTAAMVSITTGEGDRALTEWRQGYEDGLAVGDEAVAAEGCMGMGYVYLNTGRLDEAREPLDEAIRRSVHAGDAFMEALSMVIQGMLQFQQGDIEAGMCQVEDGLAIQRRQQDREGGGIALSFLASMHFARGDMERALSFYEQALQQFEEVGDHPEVARVLCEQGWAALAHQDPQAAQRSFRRAVLAYQEVGSPRGIGLALLGLAAVAAESGRAERAVAIAEAAHALAERAGVVCDHPMDPGVVARIEALKATLPGPAQKGLRSRVENLSPAALLDLVAEDDPR